jgi:hypothetical protein
VELSAGDWFVAALTVALFIALAWPRGKRTPQEEAEWRDSVLWSWVFYRMKQQHPHLSYRERLGLARERYHKIRRARSTEF